MTVAMSILQSDDISFTPPLSSDCRKAINDLPMEPGIKVSFEFSEKFYFDAAGFAVDDQADCGERYYYTMKPSDKARVTTF